MLKIMEFYEILDNFTIVSAHNSLKLHLSELLSPSRNMIIFYGNHVCMHKWQNKKVDAIYNCY